MSTFAMLVGTVGVALCGVLIGLGIVAIAKAVLPHDPPIDALYGDSLMTRMKALKHEHNADHVQFGKPRW